MQINNYKYKCHLQLLQQILRTININNYENNNNYNNKQHKQQTQFKQNSGRHKSVLYVSQQKWKPYQNVRDTNDVIHFLLPGGFKLSEMYEYNCTCTLCTVVPHCPDPGSGIPVCTPIECRPEK